ncbi:Mu-like prophage protein gp36 [Desulfonauticus submarinus]|uniref:Mu-like prophage protein gp36 n=1 Tax=Desulfonauticus submarinus TaxID=206665 RepID=A0A1H0GB07_9BACT|nr:DUF1320 domain-containing protein [Desulfonauticus submarinus]SDO04105.1 Mu-like prophage protein gp36 [Desulfonauticus submarinus]
MGYCTKDDLLTKIPEEYLLDLADDDGDGNLDETVVNNAIEQATAEIDAYLGSKYSTPLSSVPQIIKKLCIELTIYNLHLRSDKVTDAWKDVYKNDVALLKAISKGDLTIGVETETESTGFKISAREKVFGNIFEEMV